MLVSEYSVQGVLILNPSGRLDQHNAVALETALYRSEDKGAGHIIFHLAKVYSIDSYGIGMLFLTFHRLREKGIQLSLVEPKPEILKVLEFVNLPEVIPTFDTVEKAIALFNPPSQTLKNSDSLEQKPLFSGSTKKEMAIRFHRPISRVSA